MFFLYRLLLSYKKEKIIKDFVIYEQEENQIDVLVVAGNNLVYYSIEINDYNGK